MRPYCRSPVRLRQMTFAHSGMGSHPGRSSTITLHFSPERAQVRHPSLKSDVTQPWIRCRAKVRKWKGRYASRSRTDLMFCGWAIYSMSAIVAAFFLDNKHKPAHAPYAGTRGRGTGGCHFETAGLSRFVEVFDDTPFDGFGAALA